MDENSQKKFSFKKGKEKPIVLICFLANSSTYHWSFSDAWLICTISLLSFYLIDAIRTNLYLIDIIAVITFYDKQRLKPTVSTYERNLIQNEIVDKSR